MTSLLTINHYVDEANAFIDSIESSNSVYYVYVSRPQPWSNSSGLPDDSAVLAVNNSVSQVELDIFDDLLYGKRITATDVNHVTARYNWIANTVYAKYDQADANLYSKNFYVVTSGVIDQYNVYKCIDNNGNTASTVKPTLQITSGTFETGDGYIWKYMYTIDASSNTKFTTTNFIPVISNTQVQGNAAPGTIDVIRLSNTGTGYNVYETGFIDSVIDTISIKLPNTSSSLDNYYAKSSIYLKSGFGAGQVREIASYDGTTKHITISTPIDTYIRLDFSNNAFITGGGVGEIVKQIIDTLNYTVSVGYFNTGANVVQSDTGVGATVLSANSSALRVSKFDKSQTFSSNYAIRDLSDSGILTTDKINTSNLSVLSLGIVVNSGTGYTGNATVTITSNSGSGGVANAQANSTGKISVINISNTGNSYATEPTVTISAPAAQTFNANTDVTAGTGEGSNNVIALATSNVFVTGDTIRYSVSTGNTAVGGLIANTVYYIQFANSTVIALSNSSNTAAGNRITLTKGASETGHSFQGTTATARILPSSLYGTNTAAAATFTTDYSNGNFIRVGQNSNTNIRRIESVNSTVIIVDRPFLNTFSSANCFKVSIALIPTSISVAEANGTISNTNLNSLRLLISNTSVNEALFIIGEKASFVNSSNASLNANGTIAYANTTTVFLSGIQGTWYTGQRIKGESSNLTADISSVESRPNVTLKNSQGSFVIGQLVDFSTPAGANTGIANLVSVVNLTDNSIEYEIGPTVSIQGDGNGAIAVATVNTALGTANSIFKIKMINPGSNYTKANVSIYANTLYGSGATAAAVISPLKGHGSDPYTELGSRYASIDVKFDQLQNENWYYPSSASFRKVGIIKDPKFANLTISTTSYNRVRLSLTNQVGTWQIDEVVTQNTSNATGIVVSGNSTILNLRDVRGTFVQSNTLYGYSSGSTANVSSVTVVRFSSGEVLVQPNTGASGLVVNTASNTTVYLANVQGRFVNGQIVYGQTSNAYATINSITSSDGFKNLTTTFGDRFNQTSRISLSSNTAAFTNSEYVIQQGTNASGRIIAINNDLDLGVTSVNGTFSIGDTLTNSNTSANAKVVFANSTYLRLTGISNTTLFSVNNQVVTGLGANATIQSIYRVLILSDVSRASKFTVGNNSIEGQNSGATGIVSSVTNPDIVRESGRVIYSESSNTVINRSINSTEEIRLVIKF